MELEHRVNDAHAILLVLACCGEMTLDDVPSHRDYFTEYSVAKRGTASVAINPKGEGKGICP